MDKNLRARLKQILGEVDDHHTRGARLLDDAGRLWQRIERFIKMGIVSEDADTDALELSCYALQMPMQQLDTLPAGRFGRTNLRDRAEMAAEMLVSALGDEIEEPLLDRTTRLLHELPQRSPMLDEARLLADALNLDDFGMIGLLMQTIQVTRTGGGVSEVAEGCQKREQYGYWEARLKDGFHFEPLRQIARRQLEHYRQAARLLTKELEEDAR